MTLTAGTYEVLKIAREVSPNGYYLTSGAEDVLLHYTEAEGQIAIGDSVRVFLYRDTEDRMAATMKQPLLALGELALLEVVDINPRLGCFLEMGLGRNLLLPIRELPELEELRPVVGDKVYVTMGHDKQERLIARLAGERELTPLAFHAPTGWKNQTVDCRVYKPLQMGTFVICEGGVLGFGAIGMIHESERAGLPRLGERVSARVTFVREDGRVNLSMKQRKEVGRDEDAEKLLSFLKERTNHAMPYSDETPADLIQQRFQISKSAFKRALGKLMKEGLIYQKGSWTYLKLEEEPAAPVEAADEPK